MTPRAILTDIEGTTSSLAFVKDVLFPYSRARLAAYVHDHADVLGPALAEVNAAAGATSDVEGAIAQLIDWHDEDRKITPLKTLQGLIWQEGYAAGELQGHVYPDAARALRAWHALGIGLYVFSSGSVAAQRLLFAHSSHGDLTPLFSGHFDTAIGSKLSSDAYASIARHIGLPPGDILFLSDIAGELAAAREAGMDTRLLARDGVPTGGGFPAVSSFDEIALEEVAA